MSEIVDHADIDEDAGSPVLRLEGNINQFFADHLHALALRLAARGEDVIVDCGQARHVGGAALQILLALSQTLGRSGRSLTLRGASPAVARDATWVGLRQDPSDRRRPGA